MGATLAPVCESGPVSFAKKKKRRGFEQSVNRLSGALREVNSETKRRCGPPAALGRPLGSWMREERRQMVNGPLRKGGTGGKDVAAL